MAGFPPSGGGGNGSSLAIETNTQSITVENKVIKIGLDPNTKIPILQSDGSQVYATFGDIVASSRSTPFGDPNKAVVILYVGQSLVGGAAARSEMADEWKRRTPILNEPLEGHSPCVAWCGGWDVYNNTANIQKNTRSFSRIDDMMTVDTNIPSRSPSQGTGTAGGCEAFWIAENVWVIKCAIGATEFREWFLEESNNIINVFDRSLRPTIKSLLVEIEGQGLEPVLGGIVIQHGETTASVETDPDVIKYDTAYQLEMDRRSLGFRTSTLEDALLIFSRPVHDNPVIEANRTLMFDYVKELGQTDTQIKTVDVRDQSLGFPADPTGDNEHMNTASYEALSKEAVRLIVEHSNFPTLSSESFNSVEKPDLTGYAIAFDFDNSYNNVGTNTDIVAPNNRLNATSYNHPDEGNILHFELTNSSIRYDNVNNAFDFNGVTGRTIAFRFKGTGASGGSNISTVGLNYINRIQGIRLNASINNLNFLALNDIPSNNWTSFFNIGVTFIDEGGSIRVKVYVNGKKTQDGLLITTSMTGNLILGNLGDGAAHGVSGFMSWYMIHDAVLSEEAMLELTRLK